MQYLEWVVRGLCALAALRILYRRLYTLFYVSIRYCKDGTATANRIHFPQHYEGRKPAFIDRVNMVGFKLVPDIISRSDFRRAPYPYGLWEGTSVFGYLKTVTASTLVSLVVLLGIALGLIKMDYKWFAFGYFCFFMVSMIFCMFCRHSQMLRVVAHRRSYVFNMSIKQFIRVWTFNIVVEGKKLRWGFFPVALVGAILTLIL